MKREELKELIYKKSEGDIYNARHPILKEADRVNFQGSYRHATIEHKGLQVGFQEDVTIDKVEIAKFLPRRFHIKMPKFWHTAEDDDPQHVWHLQRSIYVAHRKERKQLCRGNLSISSNIGDLALPKKKKENIKPGRKARPM